MEAITFVHLSDLHIGDLDDPTLLSDTGETLGAVAAMLRGLAPAPRFAVVSGDITHRGDPASYRAAQEALAALPCPVVYALGNHDDRNGYAQGLATGGGPAFGERVIDGIHLVVLDTSVPGRIGGGIDAHQFDWLAETLGHHRDLPKLIVMHHPPALEGEMGWKTLDPAASARLAGLLRGRDVAAILTGHIHQDRVVIWHGLPVVTVSGQHATMDVLHRDGLRSVRGASFGLCRIGPAGFAATFIQLPSDRAELERLPRETVMSFA